MASKYSAPSGNPPWAENQNQGGWSYLQPQAAPLQESSTNNNSNFASYVHSHNSTAPQQFGGNVSGQSMQLRATIQGGHSLAKKYGSLNMQPQVTASQCSKCPVEVGQDVVGQSYDSTSYTNQYCATNVQPNAAALLTYAEGSNYAYGDSSQAVVGAQVPVEDVNNFRTLNSQLNHRGESSHFSEQGAYHESSEFGDWGEQAWSGNGVTECAASADQHRDPQVDHSFYSQQVPQPTYGTNYYEVQPDQQRFQEDADRQQLAFISQQPDLTNFNEQVRFPPDLCTTYAQRPSEPRTNGPDVIAPPVPMPVFDNGSNDIEPNYLVNENNAVRFGGYLGEDINESENFYVEQSLVSSAIKHELEERSAMSNTDNCASACPVSNEGTDLAVSENKNESIPETSGSASNEWIHKPTTSQHDAEQDFPTFFIEGSLLKDVVVATRPGALMSKAGNKQQSVFMNDEPIVQEEYNIQHFSTGYPPQDPSSFGVVDSSEKDFVENNNSEQACLEDPVPQNLFDHTVTSASNSNQPFNSQLGAGVPNAVNFIVGEDRDWNNWDEEADEFRNNSVSLEDPSDVNPPLDPQSSSSTVLNAATNMEATAATNNVYNERFDVSTEPIVSVHGKPCDVSVAPPEPVVSLPDNVDVQISYSMSGDIVQANPTAQCASAETSVTTPAHAKEHVSAPLAKVSDESSHGEHSASAGSNTTRNPSALLRASTDSSTSYDQSSSSAATNAPAYLPHAAKAAVSSNTAPLYGTDVLADDISALNDFAYRRRRRDPHQQWREKREKHEDFFSNRKEREKLSAPTISLLNNLKELTVSDLTSPSTGNTLLLCSVGSSVQSTPKMGSPLGRSVQSKDSGDPTSILKKTDQAGSLANNKYNEGVSGKLPVRSNSTPKTADRDSDTAASSRANHNANGFCEVVGPNSPDISGIPCADNSSIYNRSLAYGNSEELPGRGAPSKSRTGGATEDFTHETGGKMSKERNNQRGSENQSLDEYDYHSAHRRNRASSRSSVQYDHSYGKDDREYYDNSYRMKPRPWSRSSDHPDSYARYREKPRPHSAQVFAYESDESESSEYEELRNWQRLNFYKWQEQQYQYRYYTAQQREMRFIQDLCKRHGFYRSYVEHFQITYNRYPTIAEVQTYWSQVQQQHKQSKANPTAYGNATSAGVAAYYAQQKALFSDDRDSLRTESRQESDVFDLRSDIPSDLDSGRHKEPRKFSSVHSICRFSADGRLIVITSDRQSQHVPTTVDIRDLKACIYHSSTKAVIEELESYPGPLVKNQTNRTTLLSFIQRKIANMRCSSLVSDLDHESFLVLWRFLELLVRQHGNVSGPDIASLLLEGRIHEPGNFVDVVHEEARGWDGQFENAEDEDYHYQRLQSFNASRINSGTQTVDTVTAQFRNLLRSGQQKDALEYAIRNELWGHALFLAINVDASTHRNVMIRFANSLPLNDDLQTLYQMVSGRQPFAVTKVPDDNWGDWRPHLAMILANCRSELDVASLRVMGNTLASSGRLHAAHVCYLAASFLGGLPVFGTTCLDPNASLYLIGSSLRHPLLSATSESIQATEIYEHVTSNLYNNFVLPSLQFFKFIYAVRLAEYGFAKEALGYCKLISSAIRQSPGCYSSRLASAVSELAHRLCQLEFENVFVGSGQSSVSVPNWLEEFNFIIRNMQNATEPQHSSQAMADTMLVYQRAQQQYAGHNFQQTGLLSVQPNAEVKTDGINYGAVDVDASEEFITMSSEDIYGSEQVDSSLVKVQQTENLATEYNINNHISQSADYTADYPSESQNFEEPNIYGNVGGGGIGFNGAPDSESFSRHGANEFGNYTNGPTHHDTGVERRNSIQRSMLSSYSGQPPNLDNMVNPPQLQSPGSDSVFDSTESEIQRRSSIASIAKFPMQANVAPPSGTRPAVSKPENLNRAMSETVQPYKDVQNAKPPKRNQSFIERFIQKFIPPPPGVKEMILPDEKNPTILWDSDKGKWVNQLGGAEDDSVITSPPPSVPLSASESSDPASVPQFCIGKTSLSTLKATSRYVNTFKPAEANNQADALAVPAPPLAASPMQNFFVPTYDPGASSNVDPFSDPACSETAAVGDRRGSRSRTVSQSSQAPEQVPLFNPAQLASAPHAPAQTTSSSRHLSRPPANRYPH